jgi:hypothetical protein
MKKYYLLILGFLVAQICPLFAHGGGEDFMRSRGKIFVVVAVIVAVFLGLVAFMIFLERRLTKLENQIQDHESADSR